MLVLEAQLPALVHELLLLLLLLVDLAGVARRELDGLLGLDPALQLAAALDLGMLLQEAQSGFAAGRIGAGTAGEVHGFMLDRLRSLLRDKGYEPHEIEAVLAERPTRIAQVWSRIEAVREFRKLPEAEALAAANKRIQNILRKSEGFGEVDFALLQLPEEKRLHESLSTVTAVVDAKFAAGDYRGTLTELAALRGDVDTFFDKVLVNAEDPRLRAARLGLLERLGRVMNKVADISKLSA